MNDHVTSAREIPAAPYYVTMTDKFMSGWGMADGVSNKLCFVCSTYREAEIVEQNARRRGDMKYVNIRTSKPRVTDGNYWQVKTNDPDSYDTWYQPLAF